MSHDSDADQMIKTADGRPLILHTRGFYPVDFNDTRAYSLPTSPETVYWLLTAAASGVVGNLAYDALKGVISKATEAYREFSKLVPAHRTFFMQLDRHGTLEVDPPAELRDALVTIASDTLRRYKQISPSAGKEPWSEVEVRLSAYGTWMVSLREVGQDRPIMIEIDLEDDAANARPYAAGNDDGFPVRIWL